MKLLSIILFSLVVSYTSVAQSGYKVGDKINDFTLTNSIDNSPVSLNSYASSKVVVLIFTSHSCPYTKIYEERAKNYNINYESKGVRFLLINPNNPSTNPEETATEMADAAKERGYKAPYLADADQKIADLFGATKTPEVFVLKYQSGGFVLKYKGAIDDNPQVSADVTTSYLKDAIEAILNNQPVKITEKRATGCMIHR